MSDAVRTCDADGCEEQMPWDMRAIQFDGVMQLEGGQVFCSADHALQALDGMDEPPEFVTLHDPQFAVDLTELTDNEPAGQPVGYRFPVQGRSHAVALIERMDAAMPGEWRVSADA